MATKHAATKKAAPTKPAGSRRPPRLPAPKKKVAAKTTRKAAAVRKVVRVPRGVPRPVKPKIARPTWQGPHFRTHTSDWHRELTVMLDRRAVELHPHHPVRVPARSKEEDGLKVILTPTQLAAVLSSHDVSAKETRTNRLLSGITVIAGSLELLGSAALFLTPEPTMLTKAGGVVLAAHGVDTVRSGVWELWTGKKQHTLTDTAATHLAIALGADKKTAGTIGTVLDIAVPTAASFGVGLFRAGAIRAGRIALVEHEVIRVTGAGGRVVTKNAGHTIARHVGMTEAELTQRLLNEPRIAASSAFRNMEVAERSLYQALNQNKASIEAWAIHSHARAGARHVINYTGKGQLGTVVERLARGSTGVRTTQTSNMRIILQLEAHDAKPYYILTSYPVPPPIP